MNESSDMAGTKTVAGIRYVYDLAADAYIPVMPRSHSTAVSRLTGSDVERSHSGSVPRPSKEIVGTVAYDLGEMPAEYMTADQQESIHGRR